MVGSYFKGNKKPSFESIKQWEYVNMEVWKCGNIKI